MSDIEIYQQLGCGYSESDGLEPFTNYRKPEYEGPPSQVNEESPFPKLEITSL